MCFTVNVNIVKEEMEKRFGAVLNEPDSYRPSYYYHAFELPLLPVINSNDPSLIPLFYWGLIPSWVKSADMAEKIRYQTFNARAETISQKPSFSRPIKTSRCLVPVNGFFEWQHKTGKKIPHYIFLPDQDIFSLAGIYDTWLNKITGELVNSFSIITVQANSLMETIHNSKKRMPAILSLEDEKKWLDLDQPINQVLQLLEPYPQDLMEAYSVSPMISKKGVDKNTPKLIQAFSYEQQGLF
ncbi:MAG: SOS response-associated peptidase [Bacteroidota bacterium]|nr:SOS response-associated peptidase [Bacteroidota bacterium]